MSTKNIVSIQLDEAELQSVKDAIATLKTTLTPHLAAVSAQERQTIPKVGDGTFPFVEKVMEYAKSDGKFLPPIVSLDEMEKDWTVVKSLMPILRDLQQLQSNLDDTVMLAGLEV